MSKYYLGFDPSLSNWGAVLATVSPKGEVVIVDTTTIRPEKMDIKPKNKQDVLRVANLISQLGIWLDTVPAIDELTVFIETPVGSKSSRAMFSYGVCITIEAYLSCLGYKLNTVTARANKNLVGESSKRAAIDYVHEHFPSVLKTNKDGIPLSKEEHVADAICTLINGLKSIRAIS